MERFFNKRKTHCKRGHEFTPENTFLLKNGRRCKICHRASDLKYLRGKKL